MNAALSIPQESMDRMNMMIRRLRVETGRSVDDAVSYAGLKIAESGRSQARIGKKRRTVEKNPDYARLKRQRDKWIKHLGPGAEATADLYPFHVLKYTQPHSHIQRVGVMTKNSSQPKAMIHDIGTGFGKRGLAKLSWNVMVGKLGALKGRLQGNEEGDVAGARKPPVLVTKRRWVTQSGKSIVLRLLNRIAYMERAFPGMTAEAVRRANLSLENRLKDNIEKMTREAGY
jgi:hypothetical protein